MAVVVFLYLFIPRGFESCRNELYDLSLDVMSNPVGYREYFGYAQPLRVGTCEVSGGQLVEGRVVVIGDADSLTGWSRSGWIYQPDSRSSIPPFPIVNHLEGGWYEFRDF